MHAIDILATFLVVYPTLFISVGIIVCLIGCVAHLGSRTRFGEESAETEPLLGNQQPQIEVTVAAIDPLDKKAKALNTVHVTKFNSGRMVGMDILSAHISVLVCCVLIYRAITGKNKLFDIPRFNRGGVHCSNLLVNNDCLMWVQIGGWILTTLTTFYIALNSKRIDRNRGFIHTLPFWFYIFTLFQVIYQIMDVGKEGIQSGCTNGTLTVFGVQFVSLLVLISIDLFQRSNMEDFGTAEGSYKGRRPWKERENSWYGRAFFIWLSEFIRLGNERPLEEEDLWDLREDETSDRIMQYFYQVKKDHPTRGFVMLTIIVCWKLMAFEIACSFFSAILSVTVPFFLNRLLTWIGSGSSNVTYGLSILAAMFACSFSKALFDGQMYFLGRRVSLRVRSIVVELIYQKSLRRAISVKGSTTPKPAAESEEDENKTSKESGKKEDKKKEESGDKKTDDEPATEETSDDEGASVGKVVTMMSVDAERLRDFMAYAHRLLLETSLLIILSVGALFYTIGWSALASITIMVLSGPAGMWISNKIGVVQEELMEATDSRVNTTNEILQGIRVIKYFSWEPQFTKRIGDLRSSEMGKLLKVWYCYLGFDLITYGCSILLTFVTFACYTIICKNTLTPEIAFTAIALMNQINSHISGLPYEIMDFLKLKVAVDRIRKFLDEPELERYSEPERMDRESPRTQNTPVIGFENATFVYEGTEYSDDPLDSKATKSAAIDAVNAAHDAAAMDIPGLESELIPGDEPGKLVTGSVIVSPPRRRMGSLPKSSYLKNKFEEETVADETASGTGSLAAPSHTEGRSRTVSQDSISHDHNLGSEAKSSGFALKNLNISFPVGKLSIVCGPTGSGKTSLLHALLGEMKRVKGRYSLPLSNDPNNQLVDQKSGLRNTVAYSSQSAWLINATIRDNILFGEPYDERRYKNVIHACALARDFETLDGGDLTEIGEKGINVSGGQKARISLARAAYSRAKTILLDDVIAAVDAPTARHLVQQCFLGVLKNRTIVLVSHAVSLVVPVSNYVVVIKSGEVISQGAPKQVIKDKKAEGVYGLNISSPVSSDVFDAHSEKSTVASKQGEGRDLVEAEGKAMGSVQFSVYWLYFKAAGGVLFIVLFFLTFLFQNTMQLALDTWLKKWTDDSREIVNLATPVVASSIGAVGSLVSHGSKWSHAIANGFHKTYIPITDAVNMKPFAHLLPQSMIIQDLSIGLNSSISTMGEQAMSAAGISNITGQVHHGPGYYITIYGILSIFVIIAQMTQAVYIVLSALKASVYLHNVLLVKVMGAPLRFFEVTPIGRILNRFSKDISSIDQNTVWSILNFFQQVIRGIFVLGTITFVSPPFAIAIIPVIIVYRKVAVLYLNASRELKRLDSVTRSPLYSMFSETLNGVTTIRAYGCEERLVNVQRDKLDANHRAYFVLWVANRWLCLRTDLIGASVTFFTGLAVVLSGTPAGWAGLVLTYAMSFSESLLWTIRMHAEMEMNMNSVERLMEYTKIEQEPPAIQKEYPPRVTWPEKGEITFKNLTIAYAPELPAVLTDLDFVIKGGHKVGVVGRTGAGKSTLSLALFRILKFRSGTIEVDGMDLDKMGIRELRSKFTIIPQDPVLFSGSLRSNLDPFEEQDDASVWESLKRVHVLHSILGSLGYSEKRINKIIKTDITSLLKEDNNDTALLGTGEETEEPESETEALLAETKATAQEKRAQSIVNSVLELHVKENGENFSQGQRQLLCLARAILRNTKIIVMDEATASVDYETDARIQTTMRDCFSGATVLTIAHRLRTIMDYDRVLVLDKGKVAEYGTPFELATKKDGIFAGMVSNSGDSEELVQIAKDNEAK